MAAANASDIVITAPHYAGGVGDSNSNLNNQYNLEFADRLSRDPYFRKPVRLEMGRFDPVQVLVFANRNLRCQFPE